MSHPPTQPPALKTRPPGPRSRALAQRLARVESPGVTALTPEPPIFWRRAQGANVWDEDGNRYVDLTGAFGVANAGHAHPRIVHAIAAQSGELLHGMGDLHPAAVRVQLLERLCALFPGGGPARAVLGTSGADAIEIALKSALLATGRAGVVAFHGGYHGLSLGALDLCGQSRFRTPFAARLPDACAFAHYGDVEDVARAARACAAEVGAVLVEPIQGRAGMRLPPPGFLRALREHCDAAGRLLIVDEIYSGFGRSGRMFACEHEAVTPDLLCVGKGLASGMPLSACIGRAELMAAWPAPTAAAPLHTQTFLGHPVGSAAALASLAVLEEEGLPQHAAQVGAACLARLQEQAQSIAAIREARGAGLMIGIEYQGAAEAQHAAQAALERGVITLPAGEEGSVIAVTPPLSIEAQALQDALDLLLECST